MCEIGIRKVESMILKNRYGNITDVDQIILDFNTNNMNFYCTDRGAK